MLRWECPITNGTFKTFVNNVKDITYLKILLVTHIYFTNLKKGEFYEYFEIGDQSL